MIMLAQDSGLTRQCQQRYVKPADDSEKSVGSKNSELKYKMRPVLDFLTAELCNGGLFDKAFLPIYTYKLPLQLIPQPHVLQDSK